MTTRPRWRTMVSEKGSSRAFVDAGQDTEYGSAPPCDDDENFDPLAQKFAERLEAARALAFTFGWPWIVDEEYYEDSN